MAAIESNIQIAEEAGLVYTSDAEPGIARRKSGKGFRYLWPDGTTVRDAGELDRIRHLAIPPAYQGVWICIQSNGHLQATGHDDRERKQYRYHPDWIAARDGEKFTHVLEFGRSLPSIRERVNEDLSKRGLPREKILATAVALLDKTLIRVGNREYAEANDSYGLTTLKNRHALIEGSTLRLKFKGKSGVMHDVSLRDRRLAPILRRLQELPGQTLFSYPDDEGTIHTITSTDVNNYLREISGKPFTAKDFRTWAGTLAAYGEFVVCPTCETATARKRCIGEVAKKVSRLLGNTPAVCRKSYIHHAVLAMAQERLPFDPPDGELEDGLLTFLCK